MDLPLLATNAIRNNRIGFKALMSDFKVYEPVKTGVALPFPEFNATTDQDDYILPYITVSQQVGKVVFERANMKISVGDPIIVYHKDTSEVESGTLIYVAGNKGTSRMTNIGIALDNCSLNGEKEGHCHYYTLLDKDVEFFTPEVFEQWAPVNASGDAVNYRYSDTQNRIYA